MFELIGQIQSSPSEEELSQKCHISAQYAKTNSQTEEEDLQVLSKQISVFLDTRESTQMRLVKSTLILRKAHSNSYLYRYEKI